MLQFKQMISKWLIIDREEGELLEEKKSMMNYQKITNALSESYDCTTG